MFDPFNDFETAGYLRNRFKEQDPRIIKQIEHEVFIRNAPEALEFLAKKKKLTYQDFLAVHRILFFEFYPWAGQDRATLVPDFAVRKGNVLFAHPQSTKLAVERGLELGQDHTAMNQRPGEVMGLFAYGHPFLDGNGRTMLLVHMELAYRAKFSISWERTEKAHYLRALSEEIDQPGKGILDSYLLPFKEAQVIRNTWGDRIPEVSGLDGLDDTNQVDGELNDPKIAEKYRKFDERRGYSYAAGKTPRE